MKHKLFLLFAVVILLAMTFGSASAVTFGQRDVNNKYPYVGTLLFQTPSGFYSCTGTLISPRTMLTAGHCTEEGGVANLNTWITFDTQVTLPHFESRDDLVNYLNQNWITTSEVIPHPNYSDYASFPNTYDIGLVILKSPRNVSQYGALPQQNLLDTMVNAPSKQRRFTAVGYGMQGYIAPFYADDWARFYGEVTLMELNSYFNGDNQSAKFTNNPGSGNGSGGTCYGDSGGPVFVGNTNVIAAVVSFGYTPCIGVDYQFRVDTALALNFIRANMR
jgi:secreted trypsin-like serine protease